MNSNPYQILHLDEDSTYDEIKQRYRHLTRNLHPDKQPLQNYESTKQHFEKIDEAYKAISSPLRRFLFREYGITALKILEESAGEFRQFQEGDLSDEQIKVLRQLMVYLLYQREASIEMDKSKFNTKTLLNLSKMLAKKQRGRYQSKRNLLFPEMENSSFQYEMVLPDLYGFSNSLAISQSGHNLRSDPKSSLGLTASSARRFLMNYMFVVQPSLSAEEAALEVSFDRICENNLHLKFTPLSISNWNIGRPKFAIQKSFAHSQFSAITDWNSSSFDFTDYSNKTFGRSLRLYVQPGSLGLVPKLQWQLSSNLRLFVQPTFAFSLSGPQKNINIQTSLAYGYKLMLSEDLKLEITSSLGYPNYFQMALINSKFRAAIPFATSEGSAIEFEMYKVCVMLGVYLGFQGGQWWQRRSRKLRERALRDNQSRFSEQRRELQRQIGYVQMSAAGRKEKEVKYNGFVVVRAYLGEQGKISDVQKKIKKAGLPDQLESVRDELEELQDKISSLGLVRQDFKDQLCDVTVLLQNEVNGGQIVAFDMERLMPLNPCLNDQIRPYLLIVSIERGKCVMTKVECKRRLWLGGRQKDQRDRHYFVKKAWNWVFPLADAQ